MNGPSQFVEAAGFLSLTPGFIRVSVGGDGVNGFNRFRVVMSRPRLSQTVETVVACRRITPG